MFNTSMRRRLLSFALLTSILPILFISYFLQSYAEESTEQMITAHLVSIADLKKSQLTDWVEETIEDINTTESNQMVRDVFHDSGTHAQVTEYLTNVRKNYSYRKIYITRNTGEVLVSTDPSDLGRTIQADSITEPAKTSVLFIENFSTTPTGIPIIIFASPILDAGTLSHPRGVLVVEIELNRQVFPMVNNWPGMGETGETVIARKQGANVVVLNKSRHRKDLPTPLQLPLDSEDALPAIFASSGDEGVIRTTDYRSEPVIAVYRYIPFLNWGFVTKIDQTEAFAPIKILRKRILLLTAFIVLLVSGLATQVSNSITIPLKNIETISQKIANGDLSENLPIRATGEIGSLAGSIETMRGSLAASRKELQLAEKLAAIGKLAGSVAHDIRNPLGTISNSIFFLNKIKTTETDARILKHLDIMGREINQANDIITDLMDYSRENTPNYSKGDLNNLISTLLAEFTLPENIRLQTNLDPELPPFDFDQSKIRRVCHNLITNALQSMHDVGTIRVATHANDTFVSLQVKDSGTGISTNNIEQIFDPLFTTKTKGVGLGLSISKTFVEKHNGRIEVMSAIGEGTTFNITLPLNQPGLS